MTVDIDWNKISVSTRDQIIGNVEDQIFQDNVLLNRMQMRGIKKKGGAHLAVNCRVNKNDTVMSYVGAEDLNTDPQLPAVKAVFNWKLYSAAINLSGQELLINEGSDMALFDLIGEETEDCKMSLAERVNTDMYLDGSGNGSKNIDGLANLIDDATNYATFGGLSRNTYTTLRAHYFANSAVNRQLTYKLANRSHTSTLAGGRGKATMGITTPNLFDKLKETLQPHQIVSDTSAPSMGFPNILVNQVPLYADTYATANRLWWINEKTLFLVTHVKRDFIFVPFRQPTKQDAAVAYIWWAGNLFCNAPKANAQVRDLDEEAA